MANCPSCGAEIDELNLIEGENVSFVAFINNGELEYRIKDMDGGEESPDDDTYNCPCCDAILACGIDRAKQILLGL